MTRVHARVALICALVGLGASVAAAYVHYRLLFDPTYQSFCDVNTTISCTQLYLSRYSTYRGVPVAVMFGHKISPRTCACDRPQFGEWCGMARRGVHDSNLDVHAATRLFG